MNILELLVEDKIPYILRAQGEKIEQRSMQDLGEVEPAGSTLEKLAQADPTGKNHKYLQWITNAYLKGQFKLEDVYRIQSELAEFERVKSKLDKKDINQYKTLPELYDALKPFADTEVVSNRQADKALESRLIGSGAAKIIADGSVKVIELHSEEAAKFYGRGTRWCTAAENNNMYEVYANEGQLYVVIKGGEKYQFHFETGQFMDAQDVALDPAMIQSLRKDHSIANLFDSGEKRMAENFARLLKIGNQRRMVENLSAYIEAIGEIPKIIATAILDDLETAVQILHECFKYPKRWPELEQRLETRIKDRDGFTYATMYCTILRIRVPAIEKAMLSNLDPFDNTQTSSIVDYAIQVVGERWPDVERVLLSDYALYQTAHSYWHSLIAPTRWLEFEQSILKTFELQEGNLAGTATTAASYYSASDMAGPWTDAEPLFKTTRFAWDEYQRALKKKGTVTQ